MTFSKSDEQKARDFLERLTNRLQDQVGDQFTFLLVGRTGVGKSSTINSLMGREIAPIGDYEPTTMSIAHYDHEINGVNFTVIDTPGLCDDLEEKGNDYDYLELMRSEIDQVDSTWFVTELDATRVTRDEKEGIQRISEAFGEEIWEQAVIIFTFAGNVSPEKYRTAVKERTRLIRQEIAKHVGIGVAEKIPSVAVDNKQPTTPDGRRWINKLYTKVYVRMSTQSSAPFLMATIDRIKRPEPQIVREIVYVPSPDYSYSEHRSGYSESRRDTINVEDFGDDDIKEITDKTNKFLDTTVGGAAVGAAIGAFGGPAGAAVGGVVGGVIGFFSAMFSD